MIYNGPVKKLLNRVKVRLNLGKAVFMKILDLKYLNPI